MPVYEFKVEMSCGGCATAVSKVLGKLGDKVEKVTVDLDTKTVVVTSTLSSNEILETLKKTGKATTYVGEKKE